ncbi:hypothetical protein J6590_089883 [Homalodisca vitripennis]|nr:hypothetical protein J6590_089883 [Homalodisca vitripennis]
MLRRLLILMYLSAFIQVPAISFLVLRDRLQLVVWSLRGYYKISCRQTGRNKDFPASELIGFVSA